MDKPIDGDLYCGGLLIMDQLLVSSYLWNYRHRLLHVTGCIWIRPVLCVCVCWWNEE